jgi:hypothetical protein
MQRKAHLLSFVFLSDSFYLPVLLSFLPSSFLYFTLKHSGKYRCNMPFEKNNKRKISAVLCIRYFNFFSEIEIKQTSQANIIHNSDCGKSINISFYNYTFESMCMCYRMTHRSRVKIKAICQIQRVTTSSVRAICVTT